MNKTQFKNSSTLRLARTFLSKHKVQSTWRADAQSNAGDEVFDADSAAAFDQSPPSNTMQPQKKKQRTRIIEEEHSSVEGERA